MKEVTIEKIKKAGVVGAGGAGLPTHIKANANVDTVLVNGASCEPLLMSDPYLMECELETMIQGLRAVVECTGARRGIICLKGKHAKALANVRETVLRSHENWLEFFEMNDFYPAGDEHVLVHEVLGRTVPEAGIPLQVGAVVANVETFFNIAHAMNDIPVTDRYLTITGEVQQDMVVKAPVGTLVSDLLQFAGGSKLRDYRVVDGGPMMGRVLPNVEQPITKVTSGLIVLDPEHNVVAKKTMDPQVLRRVSNTVCCQCSMCTDMCPRQLLGHRLAPHKLMRIASSQESDNPMALEALLCSECGICEKFACPMLISPREVNAQIKQNLRAKNIRWENPLPVSVPSAFRKERAIPTSRLLRRLALSQYDTHPGYVGEFSPSRVAIPLSQHIGAPAIATVKVGDTVKKGDLIGEIPEGAMGARVHASVNGKVTSIADGLVYITVR